MDDKTPYKDSTIDCHKCKKNVVHMYTRKYDCGCAESILICAGCDHTIWADFIATCSLRKDLIITTKNPNTVH